jgi:hypothetical protein
MSNQRKLAEQMSLSVLQQKSKEKVNTIIHKLNLTASDECIEAVSQFLISCTLNEIKLQNVHKNAIPIFIKYNQTERLFERYKRILEIRACTLEKMILYYGEKDGSLKWEHYCGLQSKTNTFEYKNQKYGMSEEEFLEFNKSRSVTLELSIKRHGEVEGTKLFENYCIQQKDDGTSLKYFIEKLGEVEGTKKYYEVNKSKAHSIDNYINKYGETEGLTKYVEYHRSKQGIGQSKIANECFKLLHEEILPYIENVNVHCNFIDNKEYHVYSQTERRSYFYDFVIHKFGICIEFNGDNHHANPSKFKSTDIPKYRGSKNKSAQEIWNEDERKKNALLEERNMEIYYIWEYDYTTNKLETINKAAEYVKSKIL